MEKKDIIKALINALLTWLLVALVLSLKRHISYGEALTTSYTIVLAIVAGLGSFLGLMLRKNKK